MRTVNIQTDIHCPRPTDNRISWSRYRALSPGLGQCECTITANSFVSPTDPVMSGQGNVVRLRLHVPLMSPILRVTPLIALTDTLMDRMGMQPALPVKVFITSGTMLNVDGDFDGHGDGDICVNRP